MVRRLVVTLILCVGLVLAPSARSHAGEADEILLGFVYGTAFGIVFGGAMLVFYSNPDSDVNITTVLTIGGMTGAVGGVIFGTYLPDDAVENDPIISMNQTSPRAVKWQPPSVSLCPITGPDGQELGLAANLVRFKF